MSRSNRKRTGVFFTRNKNSTFGLNNDFVFDCSDNQIKGRVIQIQSISKFFEVLELLTSEHKDLVISVLDFQDCSTSDLCKRKRGSVIKARMPFIIRNAQRNNSMVVIHSEYSEYQLSEKLPRFA